MANDNQTETEGALTGALAGLATAWIESDNRVIRTTQEARHEARQASAETRKLADSGHIQRLIRPIVADALGGLLLAEQRPDVPSVTPSLRQVHRINLARGMSQHIERLRWPVKEGQYDEFGRSLAAGDLVTLFLALTYGESQSWGLGLIQEEPPNSSQRKQIYFAANALTNVLYGTDLEYGDFVEAWKRLFLGSASSSADIHDNENTPPQVVSVNPNILSVVPLGSESMLPGFTSPSQNTDRANKWRVTIGPTGVPVGQVLFQVNYAAGWVRKNKPYTPVVASQGLGLSAVNLASTSFQVASVFALAANTVVDVAFGVVGS